MKLAIHNRPGSYSDIWIQYCHERNIEYKIVNCYDSDIINQIGDCNGLLWHWTYWDRKAVLFARQLIYSLEQANYKVFPDLRTCWHFDDKIGQKYLFESLNIEHIPTWVFYDKREALAWIEKAQFPKVIKLRGGASSENVFLARGRKKAIRFVKKAYRSGFLVNNEWNVFKDRLLNFRRNRSVNSFIHLLKGMVRFIVKKEDIRLRPKEKGYLYIQEYLPNNDYDIRLVVVNDKCFGMLRYNRTGDFRSSGSGLKNFNHKKINKKVVKAAFNTSKKLKMQSVAFDFIKDNKTFKVVEISYAFVSTRFPGYWDSNLKWNEGIVVPQQFMIEEFIKTLSK